MKDVWKGLALPLFLLAVFAIALLLLFGVSKTFTQNSKLELKTGTNITTTADKQVVSGAVAPGSIVSVNNTEVSVDKQGNFSTTVKLKDGVNKILVSTQKKLSVLENKKTIVVTKTTAVTTPVASSQPAAAGTSTSVATNNANSLAASGPAESAVGAFGLSALAVACGIYLKSLKRRESKTAYKIFT